MSHAVLMSCLSVQHKFNVIFLPTHTQFCMIYNMDAIVVVCVVCELVLVERKQDPEVIRGLVPLDRE